MDVDTLRAELEEHLAKNPDDLAPGGFRDRFETLVEQYKANDGDPTKAEIEAALQQIRSEAEAAWTCCATPEGREAPPPRAEPVERPTSPGDPVSIPVEEVGNPAESGRIRLLGVPLLIFVVVLAGAYYFYQR